MACSKIAQTPLKFISEKNAVNGDATDTVRLYECAKGFNRAHLMYFLYLESMKHPECAAMAIKMSEFDDSIDYVDQILRFHGDLSVNSASKLSYEQFDFVEGIYVRHAEDAVEYKIGEDGEPLLDEHGEMIPIFKTVKDIYGQSDDVQFNHEDPFCRENLMNMEDGRFYGENLDEFKFTIKRQNADGSISNVEEMSSDHIWFNEIKSYYDVLMKKHNGVSIPGLDTSFLYFGAPFTGSSGHLEDFFLGSINYSFKGSADKYWLVIHARYMTRITELYQKEIDRIRKKFDRSCSMFFLHKMLILDTDLLKKHNIPYHIVQQKAGYMIVTFASTFHQVINAGNNLAMAKNWAYPTWVKEAREIPRCKCPYDSDGWKWLHDIVYGPESKMQPVVELKSLPTDIPKQLYDEIVQILEENKTLDVADFVPPENEPSDEDVSGYHEDSVVQVPDAATKKRVSRKRKNQSADDETSVYQSPPAKKQRKAAVPKTRPKLVIKQNACALKLGAKTVPVEIEPAAILRQKRKEMDLTKKETSSRYFRRQKNKAASSDHHEEEQPVMAFPASTSLAQIYTTEEEPPSLGSEQQFLDDQLLSQPEEEEYLDADALFPNDFDDEPLARDEKIPEIEFESSPITDEFDEGAPAEVSYNNEVEPVQESPTYSTKDNAVVKDNLNDVIDIWANDKAVPSDSEQLEKSKKNHLQSLANRSANAKRTIATNVSKLQNMNESDKLYQKYVNYLRKARENLVQLDSSHLFFKCLYQVFDKEAIRYHIEHDKYTCVEIMKHYVSTKNSELVRFFLQKIEDEIEARERLEKPVEEGVMTQVQLWKELLQIDYLDRTPADDPAEFKVYEQLEEEEEEEEKENGKKKEKRQKKEKKQSKKKIK